MGHARWRTVRSARSLTAIGKLKLQPSPSRCHRWAVKALRWGLWSARGMLTRNPPRLLRLGGIPSSFFQLLPSPLAPALEVEG